MFDSRTDGLIHTVLFLGLFGKSVSDLYDVMDVQTYGQGRNSYGPEIERDIYKNDKSEEPDGNQRNRESGDQTKHQ